MNSTNKNYSAQLRVKTSDVRAFEALSTKLGDWWGDQDQPVRRSGNVFTVSWGEPWYQFKVIEYVPLEKITWECIDANQIIGNLEGVQKEWVGTQLHWTINELDKDEIELQFKHVGLVPEFICYDTCSNAWDKFISINLKAYLERD